MTYSTTTAEIIISENGFYGLTLYCGGAVKKYGEVTKDLLSLEKIVDRINTGDVSPLHIEEILEDLIG